MMVYSPKVIPIEPFPADWCYNCNDPGHAGIDVCGILTYRNREGRLTVEPCGCTTNLTFGEQGGYVFRVTRLQKE